MVRKWRRCTSCRGNYGRLWGTDCSDRCGWAEEGGKSEKHLQIVMVQVLLVILVVWKEGGSFAFIMIYDIFSWQVTVVDSTPGLVVNKKRLEGVMCVKIKYVLKKLLTGDANCKSLGEQGAFSTGWFNSGKSSSQTVGKLSGGENAFMLLLSFAFPYSFYFVFLYSFSFVFLFSLAALIWRTGGNCGASWEM